MGLRLARAQPADLAACTERVEGARSAALASARSRRVGAARAALLRLWFSTVDAARPSLVVGVLGFKALEWWFSAGEAALTPSHRWPVPPPPPALQPLPGGVPLPSEPGVCPLCAKPRTNPAVAPSGIAYCYPCLRSALQRQLRCPVTGVPMAETQLRRLYDE